MVMQMVFHEDLFLLKMRYIQFVMWKWYQYLIKILHSLPLINDRSITSHLDPPPKTVHTLDKWTDILEHN